MKRAEIALSLRCPECGAELPARGLNESQQIASCGRCGKVIDLAQPRRPALVVVPPEPHREQAPERPRVERPPHMTVVEEHGSLTMVWRPALPERVAPQLSLT